MIELNELTYAAIITVTLPGKDLPLRASVKLTPPDAVETAVAASTIKAVKPLRDCTLADLMRFAVELEESVWAEYQKITLLELEADEEALVKISLINDKDDPLAPEEDWLSRAAMVLTWEEEEAESFPEAEAEEAPVFTAEVPSQAIIEEQVEIEEIEPISEDAAEEEAAEPAETAAPEAEADDDPLNLITVSESLPVYEEPRTVERAIDEVESRITDPIQRAAAKSNVRIAGERLPVNSFTHAAVDVLFDEDAFRNAQAHALTSLTREVAGVLVGPYPEKQPDGRYVVHVTDIIIAKHTKMHGASVTYTPESWRYLNDKLMELYPEEDAIIVGWYHTHPGFGIFLSNMDLFIHHNFFTQKWHIALVLDPVGKRTGFFTWNKRQTEVQAYNFPWPYWAHSSW